MSRLLGEADPLFDAMLSLDALLFAALAAIVVLLSRWLASWVARKSWGTLAARSLVASGLRGLGIVLAAVIAMRFLAGAAPSIVSGFVLVALAGLAFGLGATARSYMFGLTAIVRSDFAIGDILEIGSTRGTITQIDLSSVSVLTGDGARVRVPASSFSRERYAVASPERVYPVELEIPVESSERVLARARRLALLCPYRQQGSAVEVAAKGDARITVRFRAWSEPGAHLARRYLLEGLGRTRDTRPRTTESP